ncbi:hypothetical protein FACS1894109_15220 [Spirochaetia bacterium]|nr:hypothetical protein FACS1894109_15220 [Spirochaetia bacterium]
MNVLPENLKDVVIYPRDYILSKKSSELIPPVETIQYYQYGTHWNMLGAMNAFDLLYQKIIDNFPDVVFPKLEYNIDIKNEPYIDSWLTTLGFTSASWEYYNTHAIIEPENKWTYYYTYTKNEDRNRVITENKNPGLPRAIIFRDSFFSALESFTSTMFSSAEYNWRWFNESEKGYILNNKPDIIIWEMAERYITGIPNATWN